LSISGRKPLKNRHLTGFWNLVPSRPLGLRSSLQEYGNGNDEHPQAPQGRDVMAKPPVNEPPEILPPTPGRPTVPPVESPPGNPRPEVPPPMNDPAQPPQPPQELPGGPPQEIPVRGSSGPQTPYPVNDRCIDDLPVSGPGVIPGIPTQPGTM
jgi:hypothetical protein